MASPSLEHDRRPGRAVSVGVAVLLTALAAAWTYAWVFAPRGDPDRLVDQAWTDLAEARCAVAREAALAPPPGGTDNVARSDDLAAVTEVLSLMVDDLRSRPPANPEDRDLVDRWLDDYEVYLTDRRSYVASLAEDPSARLELTAIEGRQITTVLDRFADVNGMQSCMTPADAT